MSSNLNPSIPSSKHRSAAAHAVEGLAGVVPSAAVGRGHAESDSQAFARWMAQYTQSSLGAGVAVSSPAGAGVKQAATTPGLHDPGHRASQAPLKPQQVGIGAAQAPAVHMPQEAATPQPNVQARQAAKAIAKPPANKVPEAPRREAKADKAEVDAKTDGKDEQLGEAVNFTTAQGEATAYVKELQPPDHVPASDPAAMLAWLATLAQARGMVQPSETAAPNATGQGNFGQGTDAVRALGQGSEAGASAPTTWSVLSAGQDHAQFGQEGGKNGDQGWSEQEGAMSMEGLGMNAVKDAALPEAATFGALMGQALQRTPEGLSRQEGTHHSASLPTPFDSPEFPQAMADRIGLWVTGAAQEGPMTAELRLNPTEMGPVHIRIELDGQTAHVDFAAAALETREAIEASLSHLSDVLSEAGLSLSGGGVSDQAPQQGWSDAQGQPEPGSLRRTASLVSGPAGLNPEGTPSAGSNAQLPRGRAGGLDLYA